MKGAIGALIEESLLTCEVELHDSELLHVDPEAGTVLVKAWVHRSGDGMRREGGVQHTLFTFEGLRIEGNEVDLAGFIYDWKIASEILSENALIPLPLEILNPIAITLWLGPHASEVTFHGDALKVVESGPFKFVEYWKDE